MVGQTDHQKKKIDVKEFVELLERLPEEEKFKLFYMVKGIELIGKSKEDRPVA